ncbi:hypothetical protein [Xenorhabdus beddingii]|nr:hypothetical protein [Xenorhabdus beddingii]
MPTNNGIYVLYGHHNHISPLMYESDILPSLRYNPNLPNALERFQHVIRNIEVTAEPSSSNIPSTTERDEAVRIGSVARPTGLPLPQSRDSRGQPTRRRQQSGIPPYDAPPAYSSLQPHDDPPPPPYAPALYAPPPYESVSQDPIMGRGAATGSRGSVRTPRNQGGRGARRGRR